MKGRAPIRLDQSARFQEGQCARQRPGRQVRSTDQLLDRAGPLQERMEHYPLRIRQAGDAHRPASRRGADAMQQGSGR